MQTRSRKNPGHFQQVLLKWSLARRIAARAMAVPVRVKVRVARLWHSQRFRQMVAMLAVVAIPAGQASETAATEFQLHAQPSICVSYNSDEPCRMSMEVSWEAANAVDVCLRDAVDEPMLYCWEDTRAGTIEIDYANSGDVLYQLVDEASLGVLAETEIKVINRDLRSSRKRRRHVWSIL